MYTEKDYRDICAQERKRWILLLIPCLLLLGGVIACIGWRVQVCALLGDPDAAQEAEKAKYLALGLTALLGAVFVFFQGVLIAPVTSYRRHLDGVLHLRTRQTTGVFKGMEEKTVTRDGVRFYPLMLNVGKLTDEEDDRLFYWDVTLPRPDWKEGDRLTVTSHDLALGAWEYAEG